MADNIEKLATASAVGKGMGWGWVRGFDRGLGGITSMRYYITTRATIAHIRSLAGVGGSGV